MIYLQCNLFYLFFVCLFGWKCTVCAQVMVNIQTIQCKNIYSTNKINGNTNIYVNLLTIPCHSNLNFTCSSRRTEIKISEAINQNFIKNQNVLFQLLFQQLYLMKRTNSQPWPQTTTDWKLSHAVLSLCWHLYRYKLMQIINTQLAAKCCIKPDSVGEAVVWFPHHLELALKKRTCCFNGKITNAGKIEAVTKADFCNPCENKVTVQKMRTSI